MILERIKNTDFRRPLYSTPAQLKTEILKFASLVGSNMALPVELLPIPVEISHGDVSEEEVSCLVVL